jgi:hypothetical protein
MARIVDGIAPVDAMTGAPPRVLISHTREMREHPAGGTFVAAVEAAIALFVRLLLVRPLWQDDLCDAYPVGVLCVCLL